MLNLNRTILILFLFLFGRVVFGIQVDSDESLETKISQNRNLFQNDPQKALYNITISDGLLAEAIRDRDQMAELKLLSDMCEYYYFLRMDFKEMMHTARDLEVKSRKYRHPLFEAKAHKYLAQGYAFNELNEHFFEEITIALGVISDEKSEDPIIMERANLHTMLANYYSIKKMPYKAVDELAESLKAHDQLTNIEQKRGAKFMDYSNLGAAYMGINLDSAEYYAQKSIALSLEKEYNHNLMFVNYLTLGTVKQKQEKYTKALDYFSKAEAVKEGKHFLNIEELYNNFIHVYQAQSDNLSRREYEYKLKELQLMVSENRNQSLKAIVETQNIELDRNETRRFQWFILVGGFLIVLIGVGFYYLRIKKRPLSQKVELPILGSVTGDEYEQFVSLAKNNDSSFMIVFSQKFPAFVERLMQMNTELTPSEIELLAMLKLNFSSKEIAHFKFVQPKTIHNKRYSVRTKLNLSSTTNLDKWIESI